MPVDAGRKRRFLGYGALNVLFTNLVLQGLLVVVNTGKVLHELVIGSAHDEVPDQVNRALLDWLEQVQPAGSSAQR